MKVMVFGKATKDTENGVPASPEEWTQWASMRKPSSLPAS